MQRALRIVLVVLLVTLMTPVDAAPARAAGDAIGIHVRDGRLVVDPAFLTRFDARVISSTLAVVWVASGRRAAYVIDTDTPDSVHFAAGIALCRAAGCTVTGLHGEPVLSGAHGLVAAADAETHAALLDLVDQQENQAG